MPPRGRVELTVPTERRVRSRGRSPPPLRPPNAAFHDLCSVLDHQYSCVHTPILAQIYGGVHINDPLLGMFHRGCQTTKEEMHALAEAARTLMIQNTEFLADQQQWNDSRTVMYEGFYVDTNVQETLYDFVPL